MGTLFKVTCFIICLVLALATGRQIDKVQGHIQNVLLSDISLSDDNGRTHLTKQLKEGLLSSLNNVVRNSVYGVDDKDLFPLYVICQFDFTLWKCNRLSSRRGSKHIENRNQQPETVYDTQPETNQNVQPTTARQLMIHHNGKPETDKIIQSTTHKNKQLMKGHKLKPETVQNIHPTTNKSKQLIKDNNVQPETKKNLKPVTDNNKQPETDQNVLTTIHRRKHLDIDHNAQLKVGQNKQSTDQSKQRETYHYIRWKRDKAIQKTTEKPMQHESFHINDSEVDPNLSLPVDEYDMMEEDTDSDDLGPAGSLLCQMCSSVKTTAEIEKCETLFCDY